MTMILVRRMSRSLAFRPAGWTGVPGDRRSSTPRRRARSTRPAAYPAILAVSMSPMIAGDDDRGGDALAGFRHAAPGSADRRVRVCDGTCGGHHLRPSACASRALRLRRRTRRTGGRAVRGTCRRARRPARSGSTAPTSRGARGGGATGHRLGRQPHVNSRSPPSAVDPHVLADLEPFRIAAGRVDRAASERDGTRARHEAPGVDLRRVQRKVHRCQACLEEPAVIGT